MATLACNAVEEVVVDIVLGVSLGPSSIQMVVLEGHGADGLVVEANEFARTADSDVLTAILSTCEGASGAGHTMSSIGVTWSDPLEADALRDALAANRIDNVMLVSAFLAAAALAQNAGAAIGYERIAVLFVEPDTATLAVVQTSDGSITDVYQRPIHAESAHGAAAQLVGVLARLDELPSAPGGVFLVGCGVGIAPIKPVLESLTPRNMSAPEDPGTALARGAALASANAALFAESTAALAYSAVPDEDAEAPAKAAEPQ